MRTDVWLLAAQPPTRHRREEDRCGSCSATRTNRFAWCRPFGHPAVADLEVFGLAEDGSVWQNVSTTPSIDGWTGWSLFGRRPDAGRRFPGRSNPGLVSLGVNIAWDGRLRVFGAASDGSSWMNAQTWGMDGWGRWLRFGVLSDWWRRFSVVPDGWVQLGVAAGLREVVVPSIGVSLVNVVFGLGVDDTVWINVLDQYQPERWRG